MLDTNTTLQQLLVTCCCSTLCREPFTFMKSFSSLSLASRLLRSACTSSSCSSVASRAPCRQATLRSHAHNLQIDGALGSRTFRTGLQLQVHGAMFCDEMLHYPLYDRVCRLSRAALQPEWTTTCMCSAGTIAFLGSDTTTYSCCRSSSSMPQRAITWAVCSSLSFAARLASMPRMAAWHSSCRCWAACMLVDVRFCAP